MLNKFISKSPLGATLTAATLLLTISPNARRMTRKAAVKGIGAVLSLSEKVKEMADAARFQLASMVEEAKNPDGHVKAQIHSDIEPEETIAVNQNQNLSSLNVLNDGFLKQQIVEMNNHPQQHDRFHSFIDSCLD
jgi:hypothetical protein